MRKGRIFFVSSSFSLRVLPKHLPFLGGLMASDSSIYLFIYFVPTPPPAPSSWQLEEFRAG